MAKTWDDLTDGQKITVGVVGAIEAVVTAVALRDLARRPAEGIRGPKALWAMACFVQPVGPVAYLACGRR
jgi:hypothetical protein